MSGKIAQVAQTFLNELSSGKTPDAIESMKILIDALENKADPDPIEVRLVSNLINFLEKYEVMKNNVRSYVNDASHDLPGNKLDTLYENQSFDGSSRLLKY